MITQAIESQEERHVTIINTPGTYLHDDTDKHLIMLLKGSLAYLMAMI